MSYEEKYQKNEFPHNIILESRSRLSVSGVEEVDSFDESSVVMYTKEGLLIVRGHDLHIDRLTIDGGELGVDGRIDSLQYEETHEKGGFWSRLFK